MAQASQISSGLDMDSSETISITAESHNSLHESSPAMRAPKRTSSFFTIVCNITLSAWTILLTVCSKRTKLWNTKNTAKSSSERDELNMGELKSLLTHYAAALIAKGKNYGTRKT